MKRSCLALLLIFNSNLFAQELTCGNSDELNNGIEVMGQPVCFRNTLNDEVVSGLTEDIDQVISKIPFLQDNVRSVLSDCERIFLQQHPQVLHSIIEAANFAWKSTKKVCNTEQANEHNTELDALRHFYFSSYLTMSLGENLAEEYLVAHENRETSHSNKMDYFNNNKGITFVTSLKNEISDKKGSSRRVLRRKQFELIRNEGEKLLRSGELAVITSTPTESCKIEEHYPNFK